MQQEFKDWAIARVEKELKEHAFRQKFLHRLKFEPDVVSAFFANAFVSWGMTCALETRMPIHWHSTDPQAFCKILQDYFAPELAKINP